MKSTARTNAIILILSLLPFIIGLSYSVYRSSDRTYLSSAINISGSQRMRTMLISNYSQQLVYSKNSKRKYEIRKLLREELELYHKYYNGLINGDSELEIKENRFTSVKKHLLEIGPMLQKYHINANQLLNNSQDIQRLEAITNNAMALKNEFNEITLLYQLENDQLIKTQRNIDLVMISFAVIVTISGLILTIRIKRQEHHSSYDYLTGLKNRYSLFEFIEQKSPQKYIVFFIDLNKFKIINDTYGHEIGDEILIEVTRRLRSVFNSDCLFRYGGDEFIGLIRIKKDKLEEIDQIIAEVKKKMSAEIIDSYNRSHRIGLSMGIASGETGINDWNGLINLADELMYSSTSLPGHVLQCLDKSVLEKRLKIFDLFRGSFNKDVIGLNFQNFHSLRDQKNTIVNVTSKWIDKSVEYSAAEFMPTLKRKGYIIELDLNAITILEKNLEENSIEQHDNQKFMLSFDEETLLYGNSNGLIKTLNEISISKDKIIIKIDQKYLQNAEVKKTLKIIKDLGCIIGVDNFQWGIGKETISEYKEISLIKIDHQSLDLMMQNNNTKALLKEFIIYFLSIQKTVLLEGIKKEEILSIKDSLNEKFYDNLFYTEGYSTGDSIKS